MWDKLKYVSVLVCIVLAFVVLCANIGNMAVGIPKTYNAEPWKIGLSLFFFVFYIYLVCTMRKERNYED
jgi:hypothetical protein